MGAFRLDQVQRTKLTAEFVGEGSDAVLPGQFGRRPPLNLLLRAWRKKYKSDYMKGLEGDHRYWKKFVPTQVNRRPTAIIGTPVIDGLDVSVTSESTDPDNDELSFSWDMGDESEPIVTEDVTEHTYSVDGTYTITLTVSDGDLEDSASVEVTVEGGE